MKRDDIQFTAICIGAAALVVIAVYLVWPESEAPPTQYTHISQSEMVNYPYVASVDREPFHKPTCEWAQKIGDRTRVGFKSRDEAIRAGHRPCKVCRP